MPWDLKELLVLSCRGTVTPKVSAWREMPRLTQTLGAFDLTSEVLFLDLEWVIKVPIL